MLRVFVCKMCVYFLDYYVCNIVAIADGAGIHSVLLFGNGGNLAQNRYFLWACAAMANVDTDLRIRSHSIVGVQQFLENENLCQFLVFGFGKFTDFIQCFQDQTKVWRIDTESKVFVAVE